MTSSTSAKVRSVYDQACQGYLQTYADDTKLAVCSLGRIGMLFALLTPNNNTTEHASSDLVSQLLLANRKSRDFSTEPPPN